MYLRLLAMPTFYVCSLGLSAMAGENFRTSAAEIEAV